MGNTEPARDHFDDLPGSGDAAGREQRRDTLAPPNERMRDFAVLVEDAPDVLVRYDSEKRMVYINKAGERHSGMPAQAMLGKTFREAGFSEEVIPVWDAALDYVLATGERHSVDFWLRYPGDGTVHYYESVLSPEVSTDGVLIGGRPAVVGVVAVTRDVTEYARAERALRESEERLRLALASGRMGAWDADLVAGTLTFSEEIGPFYGRPREAVTLSLSEWLGGWIHPEERLRIRLAFAAAIRDRADFDVQFRALWPDGAAFRWVATRALITRNDQGVPVRAVGYARDVTQEREREAEREALILRQRSFMRDMVFSLTEGKFRLCLQESDLPAPLAPAVDIVGLSVPTLRLLRRQLGAATDSLSFPEERAHDMETAVGEAAMNAATHGGGGEGWVCRDAEGKTVQVWIQDGGKGISEEALPKVLEKGVSTGGTLGHGFWLILRTCDRIYLLTGPGGTTVVLEQERTPPEPPWLQYVS